MGLHHILQQWIAQLNYALSTEAPLFVHSESTAEQFHQLVCSSSVMREGKKVFPFHFRSSSPHSHLLINSLPDECPFSLTASSRLGVKRKAEICDSKSHCDRQLHSSSNYGLFRGTSAQRRRCLDRLRMSQHRYKDGPFCQDFVHTCCLPAVNIWLSFSHGENLLPTPIFLHSVFSIWYEQHNRRQWKDRNQCL